MAEYVDREATLLAVALEMKTAYLRAGLLTPPLMERFMAALDRYDSDEHENPLDAFDTIPRPHAHRWMSETTKAGVDRPPNVLINGPPESISDLTVAVEFRRGEGCCSEDPVRICTWSVRPGEDPVIFDPWLTEIADYLTATEGTPP